MAPIKIGIVEDELIIARNIIVVLKELGYNYTGPAINFTETIQLLDQEMPDLLLLDINLSGRKTGIDVANWINENHPLPFIFLTAYSDLQTLERAKKVNPSAFLVKPFNSKELFASIEIAFSNFTHIYENVKETPRELFKTHQALFVKEEQRFHKISFHDIIYVQSDHNYVILFLVTMRKFIIRSGIKDFLQKLPASIFLQIHRSFVINLQHIDTLEIMEVVVKGQKVPLGKTYRENLMKRLGIE